MKLLTASFLILLSATSVFSQENFPFGQVNLTDLTMTAYPADTMAAALVLNEFGDASIENRNEIVLVYKHHVRMKMLKNKGLEYANVSIPLFRRDERVEKIVSIKASSFNIEEGYVKEMKINPKEVFTETADKNWQIKKFAIPNVRVGTVIEYEFEMESPYLFNFRPWSFQTELPKLYSEFRATIPGNWRYNISLRGLLPLKKNETELLRDYFSTASGKADCARYNWAMENVPAFYEEEYMTSKHNFLSAINFELMHIQYFDGRIDRITKEWRDVEQELRTADNFGVQLRRGKDVVNSAIENVIATEKDPLQKAQKIFDFIRHWYDWNDKTSKYTDIGIKKAFDQRKGNVADINLSLIAALRYGGLNVEPMILSTRDNGLPLELFPVLSDFNYVIAKVNIGDKAYLLDATDDFLPFGLLPIRCLNGKGRVLGEKESYWYEIKPTERSKIVSMINLVISPEGKVSGTMRHQYSGYRGATKRSEILASHPSVEAYVRELKTATTDMDIEDCQLQHLDDISKPLTETITFQLDDFDFGTARSFLLNPFLAGRWMKNPFHLEERLFPVDFGVAREELSVVTIEFPPNLQPMDLPGNVALALPANGGRFLYGVQVSGSKVTLNSSLVIARPIFNSQEYPALKETFNRIVKSQGTDLVFTKVGN